MKSRTCSGCEKRKKIDQFYQRSTGRGAGTFSRQCKTCLKFIARKYHYRTQARNLERMRERYLLKRSPSVRPRAWGSRHDGIRDFLVALKSNPCSDCGRSFPSECMDFDHVRGEKLFNIASVVGRAISDDTIMDELLKCDLICANCHRTRTRRNGA